MSTPTQSATILAFDDPRLEEVLLLLQVLPPTSPGTDFRFPRYASEADLWEAAIADGVHLGLAQGGVQAEEAAGHGVAAVGCFEFCRGSDHFTNLFLARLCQEVRVATCCCSHDRSPSHYSREIFI
jgi:hypothetical protein